MNNSSPAHAPLNYTPDILGNGFMAATILQPADYEGEVVCTLIKKEAPATVAVLYVHGFNDYFFQEEMAARYTEKGFDFYAVDLRKYGRSYLPHQKFNNVRHLSEYFNDLDAALQVIKQEQHTQVLLSGHSTGGLIVALYARARAGSPLFHAVFLNSPFFDLNMNSLVKKLIVPLVASLGKLYPDTRIKGGFSPLYGQSLHRSGKGEWDYDLNWKPHTAPAVNLGWIRAIYLAQQEVKKGLYIAVPVLILHSARSVHEKIWSDKLFTGDAILNVKDIAREAKKIRGNCTIRTVPGALHDMVLSEKAVREQVYRLLFTWIEQYFAAGHRQQ